MARFDPQTYQRILNQLEEIEYTCPFIIYHQPVYARLPVNKLKFLQFQGVDPKPLKNLTLTIQSNLSELLSVENAKLSWILLAEDDPVGYGRLDFDEEHEQWVTYAAYIAYQGLGLYPAVLRQLRNAIGPFESRTALSPGAEKAWRRAGGTFHPTAKGRGYYFLD